MRRYCRNILIIGLMTMGCSNPFALRDAENPDTDIPVWWRDLKTPENVLANLQDIYELGAATYVGSLLADDYAFLPDREDVVYVGLAGGDTLSSLEEIASTRALEDNVTGGIGLELVGDEVSTSYDTVTVRRDYELALPSLPLAGVEEPLVAAGEAVYRMRRDPFTRDWRIYFWRDRPGATEWSWGRVKLEALANE